MFNAYLCVLIAAVFPYVLVGYAKFSGQGYDNKSPREFIEKAQGPAKRAHWAQLNSFEAFPAFAASIIIADITDVNPQTISTLAIIFVLFRLLYAICYILDKASIRSTMWAGGFICVITLFVLSLMQLS